MGTGRQSLDDELADLRIASSAKEGDPSSRDADSDWDAEQPNSLQFRKRLPEGGSGLWSRLLWSVAFVLLICLGVGVALRFSPEARIFTLKAIKQTAQALAPSPIGPAVKPSLVKAYKSLRAFHGSSEEPLSLLSGLDCSSLVGEALTRRLKSKLNSDENYQLLSCELFRDTHQSIIRNVPDSSKILQRPDWSQMPTALIVQEAQRRAQVIENLPARRHLACPKWIASPACFLRFVDESRSPPQGRWEEAYRVLQTQMREKPATIQAWLQFSAGLTAMKAGADAEVYFGRAREFLRGVSDPFLEREIFRSRVKHAFLREDRKLMDLVWSERPSERMRQDPAAFLDAELLRSLSHSQGDEKGRLELFLMKPESFQRFRFDLNWIYFLTEQAIRHSLAKNGMEWLEKIFKQSGKYENHQINEGLLLLKARLLLAVGKSLEALELLTEMEGFAAPTAEGHHLKGLAYMQAFADRERRIYAAREFQSATNLLPQSASPFALIVAFLDVNEVKRAETTLAYWEKMQRKEDFLYLIARGLIQYAQGDVEGARALWTVEFKKHAGQTFWKQLNRNLGEDPQYFQKDLFKRLQPMLEPDSPLGPLALFRQRS